MVTAVEDRPLRADAARNAERILRAARDVYGELGPDAPVEAVARRAGVGERTLYRRFPTKSDLIRAALDQSIAEDLTPREPQSIRDAVHDDLELSQSIYEHVDAIARRLGADPKDQVKQLAAAISQANGGSVLVIDDDARVHDMLQRSLAKEGLRVITTLPRTPRMKPLVSHCTSSGRFAGV